MYSIVCRAPQHLPYDVKKINYNIHKKVYTVQWYWKDTWICRKGQYFSEEKLSYNVGNLWYWKKKKLVYYKLSYFGCCPMLNTNLGTIVFAKKILQIFSNFTGEKWWIQCWDRDCSRGQPPASSLYRKQSCLNLESYFFQIKALKQHIL